VIALEALVGTAVVAGVGVAAATIFAISMRGKRDEWRRAADELGIRQARVRWYEMPALVGQVDGARVHVHARQADGRRSTIIEVTGLEGIPGELVLAAFARSPDVLPPTGDPVFDRSVLVSGPAHRALAMLDPETRHVVRSCIVAFPDACLRTGVIGGVDLELEIPWLGDERRHIVDAVRRAMAVGKSAALGSRTVPEALALNARDEHPGIRANCIDALVAIFPHSELTKPACREALSDYDVDVRLAAARGLGREGHEVLDAILADTKAGSWQRLAALELRMKVPIAEGGPVLESLLAPEHDDALLRPAVIAAIGGRRWRPALETLLRLGEDPHPGLVAPLATTLGELGDNRAQALLLRWLAGAARGETLLAIVTALGRVGDVEVAPLLDALTDEARASREIRKAARTAIQEVKQRLGPMDAGRVSLVDLDGGTGDLSLPDDPAGRLSEPSEDSGRPGT